MGVGDVTEAGPFSLPLAPGDKTAIKNLRNTANDTWLITQGEGKIFVLNIEEA